MGRTFFSSLFDYCATAVCYRQKRKRSTDWCFSGSKRIHAMSPPAIVDVYSTLAVVHRDVDFDRS